MRISLRKRLQYEFDSFMSKGSLALIGALAFVTVSFVALVTLIIQFFQITTRIDGEGYSSAKLLWISFLHTFDTGMLASTTEPLGYVVAMSLVSIVGIFSLSALIGILTNAQQNKLQNLRKGRSLVIEEGHTLILGWSGQVIPVLNELSNRAMNNSKRSRCSRRPCVVILGMEDKLVMEDTIRERCRMKSLRIVCRQGNPIRRQDLDIVNLEHANKVLIVSPDVKDPDISVIKTIMAVRNKLVDLKREIPRLEIIAELTDRNNCGCAQSAAVLPGGGRLNIDFMMRDDFLARIIAQTCRQPGLSTVYLDLLDFSDGSDIAFENVATTTRYPGLIGKTFKEAVLAITDAIVLGLWSESGDLAPLNPAHDTRLTMHHSLILLSRNSNEDSRKDVGIRERCDDNGPDDNFNLPTKVVGAPEKTLILGWNSKASKIIEELDKYVGEGSEVKFVSRIREAESVVDDLRPKLQNTKKVEFAHADTTLREIVKQCEPENYNHVIVLSCDAAENEQAADARAIKTLLHLSDLCDPRRKAIWPPFSIVSEMRDDLNRELADGYLANDFVVSNRLVSLLLAQLCEDKRRRDVFADLLDEDGCEIYLKLASRYALCGRILTFDDVFKTVVERGEIALGFMKTIRENGSVIEKIWLNPSRESTLRLCQWDRIITVAKEGAYIEPLS